MRWIYGKPFPYVKNCFQGLTFTLSSSSSPSHLSVMTREAGGGTKSSESASSIKFHINICHAKSNITIFATSNQFKSPIFGHTPLYVRHSDKCDYEWITKVLPYFRRLDDSK